MTNLVRLAIASDAHLTIVHGWIVPAYAHARRRWHRRRNGDDGAIVVDYDVVRHRGGGGGIDVDARMRFATRTIDAQTRGNPLRRIVDATMCPDVAWAMEMATRTSRREEEEEEPARLLDDDRQWRRREELRQ